MTVSISRMNIEYYLSSTAKGDGQFSEVKDLTSYYLESGSPAGKWFGSGLEGISMNEGDPVKKRHARKLFDELRDPITGEALGRRPMSTQQTPAGATTPKGKLARSKREAVAGFDLTFSVPKSVSVLWALADPTTQGNLYAAHQEAIDQTLKWLEAEVIQARSGHGGVAHVDVRGLIGTSFDHWESRAGDPQLHTHAVIANRVQRVEDGQWVTLDSYTLHRHVVAASEMYNGLLFDEVQRRTNAVAEQRGGQIQLTLPNEIEPASTLINIDEREESRYRVELAGVPDELIHEFSSRSIAVEAETNRLIQEYEAEHGSRPGRADLLDMRRQATLATRTAKAHEATPLHKQMFEWKLRARAQGFDVNQIVTSALSGEATVIDAEMLPDSSINEIARYILDSTSTSRPAFTRANLLAATNRLLMTVRCQSPKTRLQLINRITDTAITHAVQLSPNRMGKPLETTSNLVRNGHSIFDQPESWLYSTQTLLDQEQILREAASTAVGPYLHDAEAALEHLAKVEVGDGHHLAADQAAAAHQVLTCERQVTAIIGPAGTGKTTTMRGIHSAWTGTFGPGSVVGLAPSAVAASVLSEEVGMATENIAKWMHESIGPGAETRTSKYAQAQQRLTRLNEQLIQNPHNRNLARNIEQIHGQLTALLAEQAKYTLRPNQLLIVDEASMAATGDLATLHAQVQAVGAKLLLVGDPAQLEAVEAGGFLGWMERAEKSATLRSVWRFKNDWEANASLELRKGEVDVLKIYRENERITDCEPGEANEVAYKAWLESSTGDDSTESILIAADNESVLDLNSRAQLDLLSLGIVQETNSPATLRSSQAHIGDALLARKNDRRIIDESGAFIKNGTRLTVAGIQRDGSVIATRNDTGQRMVIPVDYLRESTELGYAVTAHRSQGVTVDKAYCVVKEGHARELLYVGMTRGKHLNQLFVEAPENPESHSSDAWGMYKNEEKSTTDEVLYGILANSTAVRLATEEQDAAHGAANDLARLVSEYDHLNAAISTRQANEWITETFGPDTLRDFQRDPAWRKIISHWVPGQHPSGNLPARFPEILSAVQEQTKPPTNYVEHLLKQAEPETPEEKRMASLLENKISHRLNYLVSETLKDKPEWLTKIAFGGDDKPSQTLTRATLLWRELADQQESLEPAGAPDNNQHRLKPQWQQLQSLRSKCVDYDLGFPEPSAHPAPTSWSESDFALENDYELDADWPDEWDTVYADPDAASFTAVNNAEEARMTP